MTLEESILHCEEVVKSCQLKAYDIERDDYKDLEECAADHRQLAEWLKDYKKLLDFRKRYDLLLNEVCENGFKGKETEIRYKGRVFRIREVAQ